MIGLTVCFLILWLWARHRKKEADEKAGICRLLAIDAENRAIQAEQNWKVACDRVLATEEALNSLMKLGEQTRELEQQILQDAIMRETRAVCVIRTLMIKAGCDESQIETVVSEVKGGTTV